MADTRDRRSLWRSPVLLSAPEEHAWAREVAVHAHAGQRDKAGEPYIRHCQRVADAVQGDKAKTVAFLHDVLEKSPGWTAERLLDSGFSPEVVAAVENLTRRPGETKDALTIRAAANLLTREVKRADLGDNLAQLERQGKSGAEYRRRLHLLEEVVSDKEDAAAGLEPGDADLTSEARLARIDAARRALRSQYTARVAKRSLVVLFGLAIVGVFYLIFMQ
ncbi:HD domain-containing protein [Ensifer adhaerens]|uniref:HD domain-containing protein n=1 Tax=Ensifer adhaerens TaxID=106592 RepID=UPI00080731CC|nr:HD domain-containing protein [Ensifer adhaerens]